MKPQYFGASESQLYGVIQAPQTERPKNEGVVLCYPFGQEYMRAHRAYRQLSNLLARKGYHVLRFDYRGTGDSAEEMESVSPDDWVVDIHTAINELREQFRLDKIALVGLRLGALLASYVADQSDNTYTQLVLWDPTSSGESYEQELLAEIALPDSEPWNFVDIDGTIHFNGFALKPDFMRQLKQYSVFDLNLERQPIFHVASHENDSSKRLQSSLQSLSHYRYQLASAPGDWNYVDSFGGILLPQPVIQAIVDQF